MRKLYSQPWSLQTLCEVSVSNLIGYKSDRSEKLSHTGLPPPLQEKLKYKKSISRSAVKHWFEDRYGHTELEFDVNRSFETCLGLDDIGYSSSDDDDRDQD